MKRIFVFVYNLFIVALLLVALLFVGTYLPIPNAYSIKIVQSGSMEPAIRTGSIVVVRPFKSYEINDVVTFISNTRESVPVTHRIVEINPGGYVTKGDANEEVDPVIVKEAGILGGVLFSVPFLGRVIEFARTPLGFGLLVMLPAVLITLDAFADIVYEIRKFRTRKKLRKRKKEQTS